MTEAAHAAPRANTPPAKISKSQRKRALILQTAMRHFAERGYDAARVSDIAAELGIAKGSIFQHFTSKDGLFLEVYKEAVRTLPRFADAPDDIARSGTFEVARHWLAAAGRPKVENRIAYQVVLLGNHGSELNLKKQINQFLAKEDPLGMLPFVRSGIRRGELRTDVDEALLACILEWNLSGFRDTLLSAEGNPNFFPASAKPNHISQQEQIEQFLKVLRAAVGAEGHG